MNLIDKIKRNARNLGLATAVSLTTIGCETAMVNDMLNGMASQSAQEQMERERRLRGRRLEREAGYNLDGNSVEQQQNVNRALQPLGKTRYSFVFYSINDNNNDGILDPNEMEGAGDNTLFLNIGPKIRFATLINGYSGHVVDSYLFYTDDEFAKDNSSGNFERISNVQNFHIDSNNKVYCHAVNSEDLKRIGIKGCFLAEFRIRKSDEKPEDAKLYDSYKFYIYP